MTQMVSVSAASWPVDVWWNGDASHIDTRLDAFDKGLKSVGCPLVVVERDGVLGVATKGALFSADRGSGSAKDVQPGTATQQFLVRALVAPMRPGQLGSAGFRHEYGVKYAYMCGSMAHGISSPAIVKALGRAGMLGFIGTAGESPAQVEAAIAEMQAVTPAIPYGFNLIHSPNEAGLEEALVDLYLARGVRLIEASAFLAITPALVRYRLHGIHEQNGRIVTPYRILAKASRVEVATRFFSPPPEKMVADLVARGVLTADQMRLAAHVPLAQDLTAEADSGGHTDNRPAVCLWPTMIALRDRLQAQFEYADPLRVGAAGGIATPASAAAAWATGADWIVTGSVNQACVESGLSAAGRAMLNQAGQADTAMAPAGDMFEMGVTVQVLKRGTMFAMRAAKLYDLYRSHEGLHDIGAVERANIEKTVFAASFDEIWRQTREFFIDRDPAQVERAERDPKHLMALVFRWYLGKSARWAVAGVPERKVDYQIWCGPAMGAFNEWAKGSHLEAGDARTVVEVAANLLYGSAVTLRRESLRQQGIDLPGTIGAAVPVLNAASMLES